MSFSPLLCSIKYCIWEEFALIASLVFYYLPAVGELSSLEEKKRNAEVLWGLICRAPAFYAAATVVAAGVHPFLGFTWIQLMGQKHDEEEWEPRKTDER